MHLPRLPPHHPPYRHVSPSASTLQSTVPPCCPHHPHYTVSSTITLPPPSSPFRSQGAQAALLPPRIKLGARGRLLTRTIPLSGPWAGLASLRLNEAPVAGRFPSNLLQRRWRCGSFLPSCVLADSATPGVTQGITLVAAVTGPPVETPVPWEYPTEVLALLPWSGRPMTSHYSMRRPGASGRSFTSPFEPPVRGQYGSL